MFPSVIDSSILDAAATCDQKVFRMYVEDWKPRGESIHLVAGKAFASGLERARVAFFVEGRRGEDAEALGMGALIAEYGTFIPPEGSTKTLERTMGALEFYFDIYPLENEIAIPITLPSGKRGIEINFVEPLPIEHPETGEPLLFCGRLDQAVSYSGGIYAMDDKTTSSLGGSWARSWDMRGQFTGYCWGLGRTANVVPTGVLVRGVSILKTKYDTQQAITYRPPFMIEEWYETMLETVERMIANYRRQLHRKTGMLGKACADYGGCTFVRPCMSADPQPWLSQYFQRKHWNPITREETILPFDTESAESFDHGNAPALAKLMEGE